MIWQNPLAWTGALFLALPIIIHMLGRGNARVQPFPTLRFLQISRLLPTRRTRLQDILLLLVRLGILVSAVAALAQPLFSTANRKRGLDSTLARAIIVDTSASMQRQGSGGAPGSQLAETATQQLAADAPTSIILRSARPEQQIDGALTWLSHQSGRAELAIISDFQSGVIDSAMLSSIPSSVGITLQQVVLDSVSLRAAVIRQGDADITTRTVFSPAGTEVTWDRGSLGLAQPAARLLGAPDDGDGGAAAEAARSLPVSLPLDDSEPMAIVFPQYSQRAALFQSTNPVRTPWIGELLRRLAGDSLLVSVSGSATPVSDTVRGSGVVLLRNRTGSPLIIAAESHAAAKPELLLFAQVDPNSLLAAALIAATTRSLSRPFTTNEFVSTTTSSARLASWQRPASASGVVRASAGGDNPVSDGHWLWGAALVLLTIEWWLRRRPVVEGRVIDQPA